PATRDAILRAARPAPAAPPAGRGAWAWLLGHPLRTLTAAAALAAGLFVTGQWSRQRAEHRAAPLPARTTWSVDVPLQSDRQVGEIRAEFSEP
ncbi:MAG: hypothetical protein NTV51_18975, partial [Verrucomicrobia bacterium]|nr:hypothetical protein [Verrucomicrobiota bacterium]